MNKATVTISSSNMDAGTTVIPISRNPAYKDYRENPEPTALYSNGFREEFEFISDEAGTSQETQAPTIDDLYPIEEERAPSLRAALPLLAEAYELIFSARENYRYNDFIGSDDHISRLISMLPELFCCRDIGEGFAAIVSGTFYSLANLKGSPLNGEQLKSVLSAISVLQDEPFLSFDKSLDILDRMEEAGFDIEPSAFAVMSDILA
jgi:hypothetical protein